MFTQITLFIIFQWECFETINDQISSAGIEDLLSEDYEEFIQYYVVFIDIQRIIQRERNRHLSKL